MPHLISAAKGKTAVDKPFKKTVSNLFRLAFNESAEPQLISKAMDGSIIRVNRSLRNLLGYTGAQLLSMKHSELFDHPSKSRMVNVLHEDGESIACIRNAAVFEDGGNQYIITSLTDVRANIIRQEKIDIQKEKIVADNILTASNKSADLAAISKARHKESFQLLFNSSSDVLFEFKIKTKEIILSDAYEKAFGYQSSGLMMPLLYWARHVYHDDIPAFKAAFRKMLKSTDLEWNYKYRYYRSDHTLSNVSSRAIVLRDSKGKAYRMIGTMQDQSKQKKLEQRLYIEIESREKQMLEAAAIAKAEERSDIGKELHDNVNQLLGASKLYLELAKEGGEDVELYLSRSSEYTSNAIEEIRKLSKKLVTDIVQVLGLVNAIEEIAHDMMQTGTLRIKCDLVNCHEENMSEEMKVNLFRIIQEQLNNILKHAAAKMVNIKINCSESSILLSIKDDGKGFDLTDQNTGIGLANIKSRAELLKGSSHFSTAPKKGCTLTITIPFADRHTAN